MSIRLTLPFPVSANKYWRNVNGRVVRSREATDYKEHVGWLCAASSAFNEPLTGNVSVSMDFYRPSKRGDLDNYIKILLDSLIGFVYDDDRQVIEIHAMRHDDKVEPRVEIVITPVTE